MPPEENADDEDLWKVPERPVPVQPPPDERRPPDEPLPPTAGRATRARRSALPLAALLLMGFAHVVPVLLSGRVWARNDYGSAAVPSLAMLTGRTPFFGAPSWAPHLFGGAPLEVLPAMPRYPLNVLAYFLEPPQALAIFVGLHLGLAAIGAWLFIRRVAGTTRAAALAGSMVYAFGGALWLRGMHPDYLAVAAWMPFVLRCTWEVCAAESDVRRRRFAALLALSTGMTLLVGGGAPIVMLTVLTAVAMALDGTSLRVQAGVRWLVALRASAPRLLAGVCAGVLIGAPGALPFLEVVLEGARGRLSPAESSAFALIPPGIGRLIVPELGAGWPWPFQVEPWLYWGILALPLALLAALRDPRGRRLALYTLVAVVAAAGALGPVHWLLYYLLPGYSLLRAPGRWLIVAGLFAGGLAARGLDAVLADARTRRSAWILAATMAAAGLLAAAASAQDPAVRLGLRWFAANALLAAAWLAGAGRVAGAWTNAAPARSRFGIPREGMIAVAAAVLLAVDFAGVVLRTPIDEPPESLAPHPVVAAAAREAENTRLFHDDAAGPRLLDNGNRWGYRNARGYSQAVPARISTLFDLGGKPEIRFTGWPSRLDPRLLRLLGVGVYVGGEGTLPPPGFATRPFVTGEGLSAWKSLAAPFDTAVVSEVILAPSLELEASTAIVIDTASVAVVSEDVGLPARVPGSRAQAAGRVSSFERKDGGRRLELEVTADRDALLVVAEGHHRRWRAWVGDAPARVVRANAIWMGVTVPPGTHRVTLLCGSAVRPWMWLLLPAGLALAAWLWASPRRAAPRT